MFQRLEDFQIIFGAGVEKMMSFIVGLKIMTYRSALSLSVYYVLDCYHNRVIAECS